MFSRTSLSWKAPITLPNASGGSQELVGIALSPNGSKLAVSDDVANAIYVLNTADPTAAQVFPLQSVDVPTGVAISDAGVVYYACYQPDGTGYSFNKLDSSTGTVTQYPSIPAGDDLTGQYSSHVLISPDNANVYFNGGNFLYQVSTATDQGSYVLGVYAVDTDLAYSPNGRTFVGGELFF